MARKSDLLSFKVISSKLSDCNEKALEPLLELAVEIAREGREGRRIGTLFTVGDAEAVMAWSRPLILNPLEGHPRKRRHINSSELWGTIKELAQLDGAFVVSGEGVFLAAGRYLDSSASKIKVPQRRRLQGMVGTLAPQVILGALAKLAVDERGKLIQRSVIALAPLHQKPRDVGGHNVDYSIVRQKHPFLGRLVPRRKLGGWAGANGVRQLE